MTDPATTSVKSMDDIMALCKRRGFIYQASEIYGGVNGFWDYGPLGAQLKKNLRDAWWTDVVMMGCNGQDGPDGNPVEIVPLDSSIIQNPKVWEASGHVGGFNDPMVDCKDCKSRFRADHIESTLSGSKWIDSLRKAGEHDDDLDCDMLTSSQFASWMLKQGRKLAPGLWRLRENPANVEELNRLVNADSAAPIGVWLLAFGKLGGRDGAWPCPNCGGELTEPRAFNLMFKTVLGATGNMEDNAAYLRPETAQGIFINFKNVVDTTRVGVPFGIAQTGKAFRNEVTPRNFTFRSREFEQMEIEFFCHPDDSKAWYTFWRDWRFQWWQDLGLKGENLILRDHDKDELAHYAKEGAGTSDIEYMFPFTAPGYGELEGIADRTNFDLTQHALHSKTKLDYFDNTRGELAKNGQPKGERYLPHVIEPSAGLDRGVLAILCEAYTPDPDRASGVYMKFHPRLAPIKAAVFPLVKKDGMPEIAEPLYKELRKRFGHLGTIDYDEKQSIGKRYARMDEAGCPFCFTIDSETLTDHTVTVRHRDTLDQERIALDKVGDFLAEKLGL
tara:strand:- start:316741 stop:318414 length:1674 start_codon:yes stop_codon:yes gene_type:complete